MLELFLVVATVFVIMLALGTPAWVFLVLLVIYVVGGTIADEIM